MSVESGNFVFHYIIQAAATHSAASVCFLTLTEKGYPKKLVFQYLEELAGEFGRLYGPQVDGATRPYPFIKFGEFQSWINILVSCTRCLITDFDSCSRFRQARFKRQQVQACSEQKLLTGKWVPISSLTP